MSDFAARRTVMVDTQVRPSDVTKFPIIEAMLAVPREQFVPESLAEAAYVGAPLDVGGRVMLEPRTFAKILDALALGPGDVVLDLGCGLGYSAAVIARMADTVVAVEADEALVNEAQRLLSEYGADNAAVIAGPLDEGAAKHGPYDAIVIEGGAEEVPVGLCDQLKEGGRIAAVFLDGELGTVRIGTRHGGGVSWRYAFNAGAPLLDGFARTREFAL